MSLGSLLGKALKAVKKSAPAFITAVVVHQVTTGKIDLKGIGLDLLQDALDKRKGS